MAETAVTYPNVAVIYDPIKRSVVMLIVPGVHETARFTVPMGCILNILPNNDPFLQQQFASFVAG